MTGGEWVADEYTLGVNQKWKEWKSNKYYWAEEGRFYKGLYSFLPNVVDRIMKGSDKLMAGAKGQSGNIALGPFQMRTFIIKKSAK